MIGAAGLLRCVLDGTALKNLFEANENFFEATPYGRSEVESGRQDFPPHFLADPSFGGEPATARLPAEVLVAGTPSDRIVNH